MQFTPAIKTCFDPTNVASRSQPLRECNPEGDIYGQYIPPRILEREWKDSAQYREMVDYMGRLGCGVLWLRVCLGGSLLIWAGRMR